MKKDPLALLTQINLDDLVSSFGWQARPLLNILLRRVFIKPTQKFAQQLLEFDSLIEKYGLVQASSWVGKHYVRDILVFGAEHIPAAGFLALSNHPGMADTMALFCALKRDDLKIIALERTFLVALPNLSKLLFFVRDESTSRMTLIRKASGHLRSGGAMLTFPAGRIEPDPNIYPGAVDSLQSWTNSAGIFIRMAPEAVVLPILVRNVIWDKAAHHPLLKIKKNRVDRERLAAALQLLAMLIWDIKPVIITIQIGKPISAKELGSTDVKVIHQAVLSGMKSLIETSPHGEGASVL